MKEIIEAIKKYNPDPDCIEELTFIAKEFKKAGYSNKEIKREFAEMYGVAFINEFAEITITARKLLDKCR
jgi:hypothetical protein